MTEVVIRLNSNTWQRLNMVSGTFLISVVARMKDDVGRGLLERL